MKKTAKLMIMIGCLFFGSGLLLLLAQGSPETGILSEITDVTIGEDAVPVITFTLSDLNGNPLSLDDIDSINFLIAYVAEDDYALTRYVNYFTREVAGAQYFFAGQTVEPALASTTQPTFAPADGTFEEIAPGTYTYTFAEPLGDDYDERATHRVGAEVILGPRNVSANPVYTFVPDGRNPRLTRDRVLTEGCNSCHGELSAHGGSRTEVDLCVMCHTPDNIDPDSGNSLDLKVMIHRIHAGAELPSVQEGGAYYVVGRNQSIADFSGAVWPQDIRNCATCHTEEAGEDYLEFPNTPACTSCHDDVDPGISLNHPGGPKDEDSCWKCHTSDYVEFDNESILGIHVLPRNSRQLAGVNLEIIAVDNALPGQNPSITFKVTTNEGEPIAPADMDYLAVTVAGPTSDYLTRITETIFRTPSDTAPVVEDLGDGVFSYTLAYAFDEADSGTYAFALEGYVNEELRDIDEAVRVAGFNPVTYANLGGDEPDPRRQIVELESCNNCHADLALHGTIRQNTEYCVLCHNPRATDADRRPAEVFPPVSINFPLMVHSIHLGVDANQPLQVYGFGGTPHDYGAVKFPRQITDCVACHIDGTYNVLPEGGAATIIMAGDELISQEQQASAVCTSCHDTQAADGHAELQTTSSGIETCAVCHGPGREFDLANAHP